MNSQNIFQMKESEFNSFRIKNMIPICGREVNNLYNPLEIGISHMIDFDKGCYIGQEVIARLDTYDKVQRKLMILDKKNNIRYVMSHLIKPHGGHLCELLVDSKIKSNLLAP